MEQNVLIIYDETGKIWYQSFGCYEIPANGVMYMKTTIDVNKYIITSVDTSVTPHVPVICPHEAYNYSIDEYKERLIKKSKEELEKFLKENPIESSCHNNVTKLYSVTEEKQNLLLLEIKLVEYNLKTNSDYLGTWNAYQEPSTQDWTLDELYQLMNEISNFVKPYVQKQQEIEMLIRNCDTMLELSNIEIVYN